LTRRSFARFLDCATRRRHSGSGLSRAEPAGDFPVTISRSAGFLAIDASANCRSPPPRTRGGHVRGPRTTSPGGSTAKPEPAAPRSRGAAIGQLGAGCEQGDKAVPASWPLGCRHGSCPSRIPLPCKRWPCGCCCTRGPRRPVAGRPIVGGASYTMNSWTCSASQRRRSSSRSYCARRRARTRARHHAMSYCPGYRRLIRVPQVR